jgi:hypothetical protein
MANENERKHDPAENRESNTTQNDAASAGGGEKNVGLTGDAGLGLRSQDEQGSSERQNPQTIANEPATAANDLGSISGDQAADSNFGGRSGSGGSTLASNSGSDLGSAGAGQSQGEGGSGFIGSGNAANDPYEQDGNPSGGFAEQGRGAPQSSDVEREAAGEQDEDADTEGSSER